MNAPFQIRQLAQYPRTDAAIPGTVTLMQMGEAGTPYASILTQDLVSSALAAGGDLNLMAGLSEIVFGFDQGAGAVTLSVVQGELQVSPSLRTSTVDATFVNAQSITQAGIPVATQADLAADRAASVTSFNLRTGDIMLMTEDILRAGGAPIRDAHFGGWITAPSVWDTRANDDTVATTNWVHRAIHDTGVSSFNGRTGDIVLTTADINAATAAGPGYPTAPNPVLGDASNRIATTLFVDESLQDLHLTISDEQLALLTSTYAPINSPQLTGIPTAPTANPGTSTGQLATTSFVMHAVTAGTAGVSSFNTRTGAVLLNTADITSAGGATLASPAFSGNPTAPTAAPGTSNTQLATTAFVAAAVTAAGGVSSFNTRTGAVVLTLADVTGTGVLASTPLTGVPTAPTASPGTSTTQIATTAFVAASAAAGVTSFMSRTGAVTLTAADVSAAGGALNASPTFTGTPSAPTAPPGTSTTQLATTAYVQAALTAGTGVTTFNGRAGAVTLTLADVTGAGGAPLTSPTFTGVPAAPTATVGTSTTQLATTAFVQAALTGGGATSGWTFAIGSGGQSTQTALNPAVLNLNGGTTAWNPSDLQNVTLSNSNLTATQTAAAHGCRGTVGISSGKYYFEYTLTSVSGTSYSYGLAPSSVPLASNPNAAGLVAVNVDTTIWINGGAIGSVGGTTFVNGTVLGIAVDLTAGLFWARRGAAGNWNNSGTANPATGAGGLSISALVGPLFPFLGANGGSGSITTANFGASAFSGVVPSGFGNISAVDYQINNKNSGGIIQIRDNTSESATPANFLVVRNNISGQPSIISTSGSDTNRSIQLVPAGTGTVQAPTMATSDSSTAVATTAFVHNAVGTPTLRSYLAGLTLSTAGSSATFSVAAGVADVGAGTALMTLASAMSKTTAAWAAGTGNGSLDTGAIANSTWYHVYLIGQTGGTTDVLISLSATAPTVPGAYSYFRRIGSMLTNSSGQWTLFHQLGDSFWWDTNVTDASAVAFSATAALRTLTVPTGVQVDALFNGQAQYATSAAALLFTSPDQADQACSGASVSLSVAAASTLAVAQQRIRTNTSAQIRVRASGTGPTYYIGTQGWYDRRGQDA